MMSRPCSDLYYVQLVYEYLLHMGLESTASQFKEECDASNFPMPEEPEGIKRRHISDLIQLFDDENELLFFKVFNSAVPQELLYTMECKKLMADLLVYFSALSFLKEDGYDGSISFKPLVHLPPRITQHFEARPMLSFSPNMRRSHSRTDFETLEQYDVQQYGKGCGVKYCNCSQGTFHPNMCAGNSSSVRFMDRSDRKVLIHPSMQTLLCFLEKECSNLKDLSPFNLYFALPFTAHPQTHPRFKHLFQDSWAANLRRKLWDFLVLHRQAAKIPDIVLQLPSNEVSSHECCSHGPLNDRVTLIPNKPPPPGQGVSDHCAPEAVSSHSLKGEIVSSHFSEAAKDSFPDFDSLHRKSESDVSFIVCKDKTISDPHELCEYFRPQKSCCHSLSYIPHRKSKPKSVPPQPVASMIKPAVQVMDSNSSSTLETHPNYENLKLRYHHLHSDYHNLIGVAAELTGALENSLRGHQIDLKQILKNCICIFPELFHHNHLLDFDGKTVNVTTANLKDADIQTKPFLELDMNHVKLTLIEGSVKVRLLLLQALRWRITQSSRQWRDLSVRQYVEGDLFRLSENNILESLLMPSNVETPHPLQQAAARLINAFASLKPGRDYISQSTVVVNLISHVLKQYNGAFIDNVTKDMLVATLQKLSLRRSQRLAMIEAGIVEWLAQNLSSTESHSPYVFEYSTALLMNLCLHLSAKQRCLPIADTILTLLFDLLSTPVSQALPYINGTIYSLLTHPELNRAAARLRLSTILEDKILVQANPHIQKQLEHILLFHRNSLLAGEMNMVPISQTVYEGEMIDDDSEEIDLLEEELDENDPVRNISGELYGDNLLETQYSISTPCQAGVDAFESAATFTSHPVSFLLIRPSTPLHHSNTNALSEDSEGVVVAKAQKDRSFNLKKGPRQPSLVLSPRDEQSRKQNVPSQLHSSERGSRTSQKASASGEGEPVSLYFKSHLARKESSRAEDDVTGMDLSYKRKDESESLNISVELPEITVDYASARELSSDDNDSADVKVETSAQCVDLNLCSLQNEETDGEGEKHMNRVGISDPKAYEETESCNGAAFVSRPKIPRTPPH